MEREVARFEGNKRKGGVRISYKKSAKLEVRIDLIENILIRKVFKVQSNESDWRKSVLMHTQQI